MEPSEHGFGKHLKEGMDPEVIRNFAGSSSGKSLESALQFAAREWLCGPGETFLLTDMAKCAVRDQRDEPKDRRAYRWANCAPYLEQEVRLFQPRALIAVGGDVKYSLDRRPWTNGIRRFRVIHWAARKASVERLLTSEAERYVDVSTVERYRAFMNERRVALGKEPKTLSVSSTAIAFLAAYRKQFSRVRLAVPGR